MHKCRELSKLPKAPRISSVNFRRQTPGSANGLWQTSKPDNRLDRNHPIDLLPGKQKAFLWAPPCRAFTLGAIPMGLLLSPIKYIRSSGHNRSPFLFDAQQRIVDVQSFDSWRARLARGSSTGTVSPMILNEPHHTRVSMSLQAQSNGTFRPHQRVQILRRFKTAVGLIATRGAAAKGVGANGLLRLVFDEADAAEGWILQGWTYYLRPSLELLKMPYPELVNLLRPALRDLWERGNKLEVQWTAASLEAQNTPRTRGSRTPSPTESRPPKHSRSSMPDAASSPTRSRYSRQNRPPSDPDVARDAPDNDTTTGYGARPDSLRGKKRGQRSPVPSELFPTVPDFDPFPVVRGTPEAFASPGRAPTATSPALGDLDPRSLLAEPNFDPFPAIFSSAPSSTAGPVSPVAPIDPGPQENIWQASQGLRAEPDFDPFPSARPTPTPTVYSASAGGPFIYLYICWC
ncbi:hypothetical protein MVEN_01765700 [Mycena venus]|uniref:Uncharacterized protein n=1 Tax=Mycena venus TaxID=2733690 RepID=A0A8H6XMI1_9AGAR|nr:hypothetical protein MVEN_01765700 [Mycena venus]